MFEKESERYADKNETRGGSSSFGDETNYHDLRQAFKNGAEFGYNKCLEEAKQNYNVSDINFAIVADYDKRIVELKEQIEKMKCCENYGNIWNGMKLDICTSIKNLSEWEKRK